MKTFNAYFLEVLLVDNANRHKFISYINLKRINKSELRRDNNSEFKERFNYTPNGV